MTETKKILKDLVDDFYSANPKYHTKSRIVEMIMEGLIETRAKELHATLGYEGTQDLIQALQDTIVCPEGICDGSGKVSKETFDLDSHAYIPDGEEDCECAKD